MTEDPYPKTPDEALVAPDAADLVMLDSETIVRCACGEPSTWTYDPATMAPTDVTEPTPYCPMHGPKSPYVEGEDDAPPSYVEMNLQGDWIATVPFEVRKKIGSVYLAHEEKSPFSRVIAVGPGVEREDVAPDAHPDARRKPMFTKPGDKVLIASYAGVDLSHGDVEYRMVRDADVVATFPEPAE